MLIVRCDQAGSPPLQKPPSQVSSSAGWGSTTPAAGVLSQVDGSEFRFFWNFELHWKTLTDGSRKLADRLERLLGFPSSFPASAAPGCSPDVFFLTAVFAFFLFRFFETGVLTLIYKLDVLAL